jgi:hypothetical protein
MKNLKPSHDRPVLPDTHALPSAEPPRAQTRRRWFEKLGTAALMASMAGIGYALARSLVPNILYEPSRRFKAGPPDSFPEGVTFLEDQRVFIFREQKTFHAISAVCTHLGCTVKEDGRDRRKADTGAARISLPLPRLQVLRRRHQLRWTRATVAFLAQARSCTRRWQPDRRSGRGGE